MLPQIVRNDTREVIKGIFLISKRRMFFVYHDVYFSPSLLKNTGITETYGWNWCPGGDLFPSEGTTYSVIPPIY